MAIKNTLLGGTDWSDGDVLYAVDINDTFDVVIGKGINITAQTSASAENNSIFRDSSDNVLKLKDNSGDVKTFNTFVEVAQADVNGTSVTLSGISETYDSYLVLYSMAYSSGGTGAGDQLQVQLNGDTTGSYDFHFINGANAASVTTNGTNFVVCSAPSDTNYNYGGHFFITVQNGISRYANISAAGGGQADYNFLGGLLDTTVTQLTAVKFTFYNTRTYVGHVKIFGVDLT